MQQIKPKVTKMDIVCAETPAGPTAIVVFGASGDLTSLKLLPSLFDLYQRDLLGQQFYILGCGRKSVSDEQFQVIAEKAISKGQGEQAKKVFIDKCHFISGNYDDENFYAALSERIKELNKQHSVDSNLIFYLSVPPFLYPVISKQLCKVGLSGSDEPKHRDKVRLIIEKPFGRDMRSAQELNETIGNCFHESQVYRIDHYLGKETVQNILMFRFANTIFEPVWNRDYIDNVQITISESVGVEQRAGYYDTSGALRDMFQNHMLQMLALIAMEPPPGFDADRVRDEKVKLLRSIRPISLEPWSAEIVRGRYTAGDIDGQKVNGYLDEEGVPADSKTETYVAAKLLIDNWRWQDVPFYVRTGKRLAAKKTEIVITFKKVPHSMFLSAGFDDLPANVLVLKIQPDEGMSLQFQAKRPGSKLCMGTLEMQFNYADLFSVEMPEAYGRLLLDVMLGDQTLFNRYDSVERAWELFDPVLQAWGSSGADPEVYPAGAESFPAADALLETNGHKWRSIV